MENKLQGNAELKADYIKFMHEYQDLGHMKLNNDQSTHSKDNTEVWLPHHAIIRIESSTTKVRVVFDGSAKTTSVSLNDTLMVGPTIQEDLRGILL